VKCYRRYSVPLVIVLLTYLTSSIAHADDGINLRKASARTPFIAGCNGAPQTGTNYPNAEVEPWIAVNPRNSNNLIGVWQQDRWSDGGANGLLTGISFDGGQTWNQTAPHFTRCAGGNSINGGDYERASDPWVSFSPNGTAHQISLSFDVSPGNEGVSAILVSRSLNGGSSWSEPITLQFDNDPNVSNDKEAITADPRNSQLVYAVWDRLTGLLPTSVNFTGPTLFARSTDGGKSWEPTRVIYDPGLNAQTIANQIVVLPNGKLLNLFTLITTNADGSSSAFVAVLRSTDKGATWSQPIIVNTLQSVGVTDPKTGEQVRTGDIIPDIAVSRRTGAIYVVWQDARFSGGLRDGIVLSKSTDDGSTWSAPVQINRVPTVQAFTASVDITNDGTLGVTYYDFRRDTSDQNVLLTNYWLTTSQDGGGTWSEQRVAGPFDMRIAPVAGGFFLGDYEGLTHRDNSLLPFFVKTSAGNLTNRTNVFAALNADDIDKTTTNTREEANAHPQSLLNRVRSHRAR
jgi:Neuraminidase (sialidase)